jgi:hypothetical protein
VSTVRGQHQKAVRESDLQLSLTKPVFDKIQLRQSMIEQAVTASDITLKGDQQTLAIFIGYYEEAGSTPISLTIR